MQELLLLVALVHPSFRVLTTTISPRHVLSVLSCVNRLWKSGGQLRSRQQDGLCHQCHLRHGPRAARHAHPPLPWTRGPVWKHEACGWQPLTGIPSQDKLRWSFWRGHMVRWEWRLSWKVTSQCTYHTLAQTRLRLNPVIECYELIALVGPWWFPSSSNSVFLSCPILGTRSWTSSTWRLGSTTTSTLAPGTRVCSVWMKRWFRWTAVTWSALSAASPAPKERSRSGTTKFLAT